MIEDTKYLGNLCKREHKYLDTNNSLRFITNQCCVKCTRLNNINYRRKSYHKGIYIKQKKGEIYFIGVLCKRKHKFNNKMKSLRYKINHSCIECSKIDSYKRKSNTTQKLLNYEDLSLNKFCPKHGNKFIRKEGRAIYCAAPIKNDTYLDKCFYHLPKKKYSLKKKNTNN